MVPGAKSAGANISVTAPFDDSAIADVAVADLKTVETALATAAALFADRDGWLSPGLSHRNLGAHCRLDDRAGRGASG